MTDKINDFTVNAYTCVNNLMDDVKKLEYGDADSSGSTLRTMGIVLLVVAVVLIIGGAILAYALRVSTTIGATSYPW